MPTQWIERHRRTVEKLKANEFGETHDPRLRYYRDSDQERDRADLPDIELGARHGVTWIRTMIEAEQRDLRERIEWLKEAEAQEESEAMLRARLDPSDEGRLLRRYESEAERGLFKVMDLLRGGVKAWAKEMEVNEQEEVKMDQSVAEVGAVAVAEPRNEANPGGVGEVESGVATVEVEGVSVVQFTVGRPTDPPDRK